jgi:hypothetical protein
MSYEKSPDYGGPKPTLIGILIAVAVVVAIAAGWAWLTRT